MAELVPFAYADTAVRTLVLDGEPWFVAADVCAILGYRMASDATRRLDEDERGTHSMRTPGGEQSVTIVNEAGLFNLIIGSKLPEAKAFRRWVTHEVLPSIRKTGGYQVQQIPRSLPEALRAYAGEVEARELAEHRAALLEGPAHSWEALADASGDYSLREAAQILDRDPAISTGQNRLLKYLREIEWVDRNGRPYQSQVDLGRLAQLTRSYDHPHTGEPQLATQIRVTVKGLQALHKRLGGQRALLVPAQGELFGRSA